jgi:hypothetical protein
MANRNAEGQVDDDLSAPKAPDAIKILQSVAYKIKFARFFQWEPS